MIILMDGFNTIAIERMVLMLWWWLMVTVEFLLVKLNYNLVLRNYFWLQLEINFPTTKLLSSG
jgi:hypothetical protein